MRHFLTLLLSFFLFTASIEANYILRYVTIDNGGILFTGNTLGLSKTAQQNQPGGKDSIGAFITTDLSKQVGNYLPGTTLVWQENSSTASLDLPDGSTVLYAELIWSGSYGFNGQITGNEPNTPITITTPLNTSFSVTPDPATAQTAVTPGFTNAGNYTRSADVTTIVQAGGAGIYTVGGIPATISRLDDSHNAAGWTLAVVFHNGSMITSNLSLFVGCEQASTASSPPATVSGFCAPPSGLLGGSLSISAIEGDANIRGDTMLFGSSLPLTSANALSGVNNLQNNFFASQINTLLPFNGTQFVGSGQLDTRGSFGNFNSDPVSGQILPGSRQGYDITTVDISNKLVYNQTTAYAKGTTTGDDYTINALGMQIQVGAPTFQLSKQVNGLDKITASQGDVVTFTCTVQNTGTDDANPSTFIDTLETGLSYVPGTLTIDLVPTAGDPTVGVPLGAFAIGQTATIQFNASIDAYPSSGNVFFNSANVDYTFQPCLGSPVNIASTSNEVQIELPFLEQPNLVSTKLVNSSTAIGSSIGEKVIFETEITNTGTADALNVVFQDILQDGLEKVSGSVLINGTVVTPEPDLSVGFPVGTIAPQETVTVLFEAIITKQPVGTPLFLNSAVVNYDYMQFLNVFVPLPAVTTNTVSIDLNVAPLGFDGVIRKCRYLNGTKYCVATSWVPAYSYDVLYYEIYSGSKLIKTVSAETNTQKLCGFSKLQQIYDLNIVAVYANGEKSDPLPLKVL